MPKKIREFCHKCNQITTQLKEKPTDEWKCLCCESGKNRSQSELEEIKKRNQKERLNLRF